MLNCLAPASLTHLGICRNVAHRPFHYLLSPSSAIRGTESALSSGLLKVDSYFDACWNAVVLHTLTVVLVVVGFYYKQPANEVIGLVHCKTAELLQQTLSHRAIALHVQCMGTLVSLVKWHSCMGQKEGLVTCLFVCVKLSWNMSNFSKNVC